MTTNARNILQPKNILLVEDDILLADMLDKNLSTADFVVTTAYTGNQVIELTKNYYFDLIFLDLLLPGKDGFTVLKELKADPNTKDVPVIILSNLGEVDHIDKALRLGAADYIIKANTSPEQVRAIANKHLLHHTARIHSQKD